ncbi:hypothetical protein H0B42_28845 [Rhodococcus aetherivorans]|nr:hypothetical protein [Rhodococcus aetherivorans]
MPDPSAIDIGAREDTDIATKSEATPWRDIWGAGQGLDAVNAAMPVAEIVARLSHEYAEREGSPLAVGSSSDGAVSPIAPPGPNVH